MASRTSNTNHGNTDEPTVCYFKLDNGEYLTLAEGLEHDQSSPNIWSEFSTQGEVRRVGPSRKDIKKFRMNDYHWCTEGRAGSYIDTETDTKFKGDTISQMGSLAIAFDETLTKLKSGRYSVTVSGIKAELEKLKDTNPTEYSRLTGILNERSTFKMIPQKDGSFLAQPSRESWVELTGLCRGDVACIERVPKWTRKDKITAHDLDLTGKVIEC